MRGKMNLPPISISWLRHCGKFESHQKLIFFYLKCTKIAGGWGYAPDPAGGAYSTHCWRGWRWGEIWIWLYSQFLDYATVVNLYRTKSFLFDLKCTKIAGGWGSAPDPAGGAYSAPPDPLAVKEGRGGEGWLAENEPPFGQTYIRACDNGWCERRSV